MTGKGANLGPGAVLRSLAGGTFSRVVFVCAASAAFIGAVIDPGQSPVAAVNDKAQHVCAFAVLGLFSCFAFPPRDLWQFHLPFLAGYGLLIESVQWWLPWREFSLLDLAADIAGIVLILVAVPLLSRRLP